MRALAARHDVLAIEVIDPRELELPDVGVLELIDTETGRRIEVQTASVKLRQRYAEAAAAQRAGDRARRCAARAPSTWCCAPTATGSSTSCSTSGTVAAGARGRAVVPMSFLAGWRLVCSCSSSSRSLVAYVIVQRQRRKYVVRFTNVDLLASVAPKRPGWRRHLAAALPAARAGAVGRRVRAAARGRRRCRARRATVMLAFDVSQSMAADDVKPTRLEAAQHAAVRFADILPPEVQARARRRSPGSASVRRAADSRTVRSCKAAVRNVELQQRTAIGEAIFASLGAIETIRIDGKERKVRRPRIVRDVGRLHQRRPAQRRGRRGRGEGEGAGVDDLVRHPGRHRRRAGRSGAVPADREALRKIADDTGGRFASAATEKDLRKTYEDLGSRLAEVTRRREVTPWFIGAALLFAFVAAGTSLVWTSRLP